MRALLRRIRQILRDRKTRRIFTRLVSTVAAIVVFVTTYALVLPAITMEAEAQCGIEAHQHDDSCYEDVLVCDIPESPGHHHDESCYSVDLQLICRIDEHQHDAGCYDENGKLTCGKAEHVHSEENGCYKEVRDLVCGQEENAGHKHDDSCYKKVLTCGKEVHTHSQACYRSDDAEINTESAAVSSTGSAASIETNASSASTETVDREGAGASASTSETDIENTDNTDNTDNTGYIDSTGAVNSGSSAASGSSAGSGSSTASGKTTNDEASALFTSSTTSPASSTSTVVGTTSGDAYVPVLDSLDFDRILTDSTGLYYFHAKNGEAVPENSVDITDWKPLDEDTVLAPADIIRVYLAYSIPAGSLNETNAAARYRLPANIHLSDSQMESINSNGNGISNQYVNMDTLEITDPVKYSQTLGVEAIEGTRKPSDNFEDYFAKHKESDGQEYISATVKVEDVYDTDDFDAAKNGTRTRLGTDLVFTFTPYSVRKNQHTYDSAGKPNSAGQEIQGWMTFDLRTDQIDFETIDVKTKENKDSEQSKDDRAETDRSETDSNEKEAAEKEAIIVFVSETIDPQSGVHIDEISQTLHLQEITAETESVSTDKDDKTKEPGKKTDSDEESESDSGKDANPDAEEKDDKAEKTASLYPALKFRDSITASMGALSTDTENGKTNAIPEETELTVYVEADEGTFPEGTTMKLSTVEDMDTVASAVEEAVTADDAVSSKTRGFHAVDISFWNTEGTEIEPLKPIRVSIKSESIKQAVEDTSTAPVVVHVTDSVTDKTSADKTDEDELHKSETANKVTNRETSKNHESELPAYEKSDDKTPSATIVETEKQILTEKSEKDDTDTIIFETGIFSVYAIVYTVDFHWEVDGKAYEFNLPGGGFVSFTKLMEVLGVAENEEQNDSEERSADAQNSEEKQDAPALTLDDIEVREETRQFVTDVEKVEFSTPELLSVSKVADESTVGAIKEDLSLECEYSAKLTEEDIAKINDTKVDKGDWALISLKPFDTQETLTITMKDGGVFTVVVTDSQSSDPFGLVDNEYIITNDGRNMSLRWRISNDGTGVRTGNVTKMADNVWNFEYDEDANEGVGGYYLCAVNGEKTYYLNVTDGEITLTDTRIPPDGEGMQEGAKYATPLMIHYDEGSLRYTISASSNGIGSYLTFQDANTITIDSTTANPSNTGYNKNLLQFRNPDNPSDLPATVGTWDIKSDGIKLSLFDYQGYVYKHYYYNYNGQQQEGDCDSTIDQEWGSNERSDWLRAGDGINRNRSLLFTGTGMSGTDGFNNFTGVQGTYYSGSSYQGIVENNAVKIVNDDGSITYYPRLTQDKRLTDSDRNDEGSLAYLFDGDDRTDRKRQGSNQGNFKYKTVYDNGGTGLEGLLRKDELGYYYYDSEQNYARLNAAKDEIIVYADTYEKGKGQTEVKTEKIGMFPFDDYDTSKTEEKTPANRNNGYNHQFGMSISAEFVYPPNGIVPETGLPETFEFSGDDDVWVFIDGVLVLDLGGVHQPISGKIDFSKLNDNNNGVIITHFNTDGDEFTYQQNQIRSIQEAFTKARKTFDSSPYSTHQIDFFYLERGGADSNCSIRFNLLFMKQTEIAKQINGLTPVERAKYRDDTFNFETGVKHNDNGIHMHDNSVSYWSNDANWRDKKDKDNKEFETYVTSNQTATDPVNNYTIKKYQNGSTVTGEVMSDGQFTLKDGESMTITHMPASDIFYAAEENQPLMRRYETPHAERNYVSSADSKRHEEETALHVANAKGDGKVQDWETRAYKASETDLLTFTNTLKEKNFTVRKIWEDSKDRDVHDPVFFKLRATVDGEDYSNKINAQWTETTDKTKTTTTDVYDPTNNNLKYQLKKENNWEITFEHLPARTNEENGGREIIYSVIEDPEPQTYSVIYNPPEKTNVQYLDLFKFWPDGNDMHDGTTVSGAERKNEVIKTYIQRNDGKYVKASLDENGEYVYSGVVDKVESATEFVITSDNRQRVLQPSLASYNLSEMFDYAGRVNKVPKSNADELPEPEEGEEPQTTTPYTYELVQLTDEDDNTKGLVMFARPLEDASILNKKDQIYIEKEWFDSDGNKLTEEERPDSITYSIYQLVHEHEWAVYDKTTKQWDYSQKTDGDGWYVVQEGEMVNGVWKDGLEMRKCRFGSCNHYTEERTQVFEPCQTHNFGEWVGEERTCTEGAEQTRVCQRCGATETRELEPLGHAYQIDEQRSQAATCTAGGHEVHVCSRCGDEYEVDTQALDHQWPLEWTISGNTKTRECQRCHEVETINLNDCFPGTEDCYLVDWNDVWPKWSASDDMNAKKPVRHSRIFKYNNKYYVIYKDNAAGVDRTNWGNGAATPQEILNYVLEVKTPVKNANDIWGTFTSKTGIGGTGPNQIQRGSLVKDGDDYYVYLSDQYGSGVGIKRPAVDNINWYKVPTIDEGTNGANGSNGTNGLHSANVPSPASSSGKTFSISQKPALRAGNDNKAGDGEDEQENEQEPPVDGGTRGQATNKDLTLSILLADLNLSGLGVKNPNTGDKLVEFSLRQTLETKDDSDTLVENEDNLWRTVVDVPLAKEGFEYRYYIVEDVPSPGVELEGYKYEITYSGQSNGLTDEGVTRITNTLLRTGSLKITKKVTINNAAVEDDTKPSLADGTYTFTVTKKGDDSFEPRTVTVTITNGQAGTEELKELEPGTYIVKENSRENHTTLTMINNELTTSDQAEVIVEAGKVADTAPVVSFTNNLVNTSIRVIKVRQGTETPIPGAKFTLTRVDENGRNISGSGAYSSGEQTVDSDGNLEFTGLWDGRYRLEETLVPDGYNKLEGPYYITIDQSGTGALDISFAHNMISPESGNEYTIENEPGAALPNTGGLGISLIYFLGFMLTGIAGTSLVMRNRRRAA